MGNVTESVNAEQTGDTQREKRGGGGEFGLGPHRTRGGRRGDEEQRMGARERVGEDHVQ